MLTSRSFDIISRSRWLKDERGYVLVAVVEWPKARLSGFGVKVRYPSTLLEISVLHPAEARTTQTATMETTNEVCTIPTK